jgi:hypothetical protein
VFRGSWSGPGRAARGWQDRPLAGVLLLKSRTEACIAIVRLLLERGADPTLTPDSGLTPLIKASSRGQLEVVRLLLDHPSGEAMINKADRHRLTLWWACRNGRVGVVRPLLEGGADPTIIPNTKNGKSAIAIAREEPESDYINAEGRRECVAELEVSLCLVLWHVFATSWLRLGVVSCVCWQEAERAYLLFKARQVADQQGSGAVAVRGQEGEAARDLANYVVNTMKKDLFPDLMNFMC